MAATDNDQRIAIDRVLDQFGSVVLAWYTAFSAELRTPVRKPLDDGETTGKNPPSNGLDNFTLCDCGASRTYCLGESACVLFPSGDTGILAVARIEPWIKEIEGPFAVIMAKVRPLGILKLRLQMQRKFCFVESWIEQQDDDLCGCDGTRKRLWHDVIHVNTAATPGRRQVVIELLDIGPIVWQHVGRATVKR